MQRRNFVAAAAMSAASYSRVLGANDRVRLGLIGAGDQGQSNWKAFLANPDTEGVAVCDVYQPHLRKGVEMAGGGAASFSDYRKLIERKDVDAVIISTPDHWHALPMIDGVRAGKDVYVEKPLSLTIAEAQAMLKTAQQSDRVVQVGSQQRSGPHYAQAVEIIRSGRLGRIAHVQASSIRNAMPGFGSADDQQPPPDLDWNMWLGPAPMRPYNPMRAIYHFRRFWDYSGGQMTNWGAHDVDIVRWAMDVKTPQAVAGFGGRFAMRGMGETPDIQEVIYQFPEFVLNWTTCEVNSSRRGGIEFHGTDATMRLTRGGIEIIGEEWKGKDAKQPGVRNEEHPGTEQHKAHVRNFLDCVKSRKTPNASIEEGYHTAVTCHLGNIATRLGRSLKWDAAKGEIAGDTEANTWLSRPYRAPWKLG